MSQTGGHNKQLTVDDFDDKTADDLIFLYRAHRSVSGVAVALKTVPTVVDKLMVVRGLNIFDLDPNVQVTAAESTACRNLACAVLNLAFTDAALNIERRKRERAYAFLDPMSAHACGKRDFWCEAARRDPGRIDNDLPAMIQRRRRMGSRWG